MNFDVIWFINKKTKTKIKTMPRDLSSYVFLIQIINVEEDLYQPYSDWGL